MAVMIYALVIYQMRARSIRLRTGAPYDDRLGPVSAQAILRIFLSPLVAYSHLSPITADVDTAEVELPLTCFQTVLCLCLLGMSFTASL
jgi:hypothetical protein